MRNRFFAQILLCACLSAGTSLAAAAEEWRQLKTPHYTVISQLSDQETRQWAGEFDEFIDSVSSLLQLQTRALPPLTVILFDSDRGFAPYRPARPNGRSATAIGGFFARMETWSVIGLAERADKDQTRELIFHEALHWLTSGDTSPRPRWFGEGFAELFSTYRVRFDKLQFGHPIGDHIGLLRARGLMPMQEFLEQQSSVFDRDDHIGRYYAQSWLLTHYLLLSNRPERRQQLQDFLAAYRTQSADKAFAATFGDYEALQKDLDSYVDEPRFGYTVLPRKPRAKIDTAITPASPAFVEIALGKLALGTGNEQLASRHAERARELDPAGPAPHELSAWIALRGDGEATASAARSALATGSRDPQMFVMVADAMAGGEGDPRRRVGMYETAINLNPGAMHTYLRLAEALQNVEPTAQDAEFLALGRRAFPEEGMLEVGLALLDQRRGERESALKRLDTATTLQLDEGNRRFVEDLRAGWQLEALFEQGAAALRANRTTEARATYERILATPGLPPHTRQEVQELLGKLAAR